MPRLTGKPGDCWFETGNPQGWYGQSVRSDEDARERRVQLRRTKGITIDGVLELLSPLDYMHLDIQGAELDFLSYRPGLLDAKFGDGVQVWRNLNCRSSYPDSISLPRLHNCGDISARSDRGPPKCRPIFGAVKNGDDDCMRLRSAASEGYSDNGSINKDYIKDGAWCILRLFGGVTRNR
jgi:hypothetical protein